MASASMSRLQSDNELAWFAGLLLATRRRFDPGCSPSASSLAVELERQLVSLGDRPNALISLSHAPLLRFTLPQGTRRGAGVPASNSSRPNLGKEFRDLALQPSAFGGQRLGRGQNLRGGCASFLSAGIDLNDAACDLSCPLMPAAGGPCCRGSGHR